MQGSQPDAELVVPRAGVIREWAVRGARGEVTLAVLRARDGGSFQIALSSTETTGSADVHRFATDLAVEPGDTVGLQVRDGAAVGVREGVSGARMDRWMPPLAGLGRPPDPSGSFGTDRALLLRVGLAPGATPRPSRQVTGSAAAALPAGRERARRTVRVGGVRRDIVLVQVGEAHALDSFDGDRRVARIAVPDMLPSAQIVRFLTARWDAEQSGVDLFFVGRGSARVVQHGYVVSRQGFQHLR